MQDNELVTQILAALTARSEDPYIDEGQYQGIMISIDCISALVGQYRAELCDEAAAEIERLRAGLQALLDIDDSEGLRLDDWGSVINERLQAALAEARKLVAIPGLIRNEKL